MFFQNICVSVLIKVFFFLILHIFFTFSTCLDTKSNSGLFIQMGIKPPIPISCVSATPAKSGGPSYSKDIWLHVREWVLLFNVSAASYIQSGLFTGCLLPGCLYLLRRSSSEGSLEISWWRDRNVTKSCHQNKKQLCRFTCSHLETWKWQ